MNRKKYFIFKKIEGTYVLFCYNILNKGVNKMTKENPSNYKTLQIWIKKGHRMYSYFQEC
ncbi:transposase, partial [Bacillus thuringiensis]